MIYSSQTNDIKPTVRVQAVSKMPFPAHSVLRFSDKDANMRYVPLSAVWSFSVLVIKVLASEDFSVARI